LPAKEEKGMSVTASTDASQRSLRFIARCLAAREKAVKCRLIDIAPGFLYQITA
jgi:hypothetical protein